MKFLPRPAVGLAPFRWQLWLLFWQLVHFSTVQYQQSGCHQLLFANCTVVKKWCSRPNHCRFLPNPEELFWFRRFCGVIVVWKNISIHLFKANCVKTFFTYPEHSKMLRLSNLLLCLLFLVVGKICGSAFHLLCMLRSIVLFAYEFHSYAFGTIMKYLHFGHVNLLKLQWDHGEL